MGGNGNRGMPAFDDGNRGWFTGSGGTAESRPGHGQHPPQTSAQPTQPSEISKPLPVSLEDLYHGVAAKRMKVSRKLLNGTMEEKVSSARLQSVS